jgi:Ndr family
LFAAAKNAKILYAIFQIQDCGMVLEEQPGKVSEAFRLFLQGQGYGKCSTPQ